jgi:hypothetical protein
MDYPSLLLGERRDVLVELVELPVILAVVQIMRRSHALHCRANPTANGEAAGRHFAPDLCSGKVGSFQRPSFAAKVLVYATIGGSNAIVPRVAIGPNWLTFLVA